MTKVSKKSELMDGILNMFNTKPEVKKSNELWPTETGLYSLSGVKSYMKAKGFTTDQTDQGMHEILNMKDNPLKSIDIWNKKYKSNYPYFYIGLDDDKLKGLKKVYESI